jgi:hypothetical protein
MTTENQTGNEQEKLADATKKTATAAETNVAPVNAITENAPSSETTPLKKPARKMKKSSAFAAAAAGRSALDAVAASASQDVLGSSGLINTGPIASYNEGE